jgi:hypothetical protein
MGTQSVIDEVDIRRRIAASEVQHGCHPSSDRCAPPQQQLSIVDTQDIDLVGFPRDHSENGSRSRLLEVHGCGQLIATGDGL